MAALITEKSANNERRFPNLETVVGRCFRTPSASDCKDRGTIDDPSVQRRIRIGKQINLSQQVKRKGDIGWLSPEWVEWLMGWPIGSTDIDCEEMQWLDIATEPDMPRVAFKVPEHESRLKALGNGQVPICAATAWRILSGEYA